MAEFIKKEQALLGKASKTIEKKANWVSRSGSGLFRNFKSTMKSGSISFDVSPDFADSVIDLIDSSSAIVANAMQRHLVPVAQKAKEKWPVDSGFSKEQIGLNFAVGLDGEFTGKIENSAFYVDKIRPKGGGPLIVDTLIVGPSEKAAVSIEKQIANDIIEGGKIGIS
jgi:hypothetical protein